MTRDDIKRAERVLSNDDVQLAMRLRCEEQGHEYENRCTTTFIVYQGCKWCDNRR